MLQNKSGTAGASTNYVLSNDLGTDSTYYGEFGMNSSVFSASTPSDFFSINNGIYFSGHDGDVIVGSGNGYKHYLAWGTSGQSAHVINATGALGFSTNLGTTPALSGTTGYGTSGQALVTAGSTAAPAWGTVGINGGGTNGTATPTSGAVPYGTGTAYAFTAAGTTGQVLTSNGSSAPTWNTLAYATITDDTTTNATRYPLFASATTGNLTTEYVSSTKFQFNPSTGYLTVTGLTSPVINNPTITNYTESVVAIGNSGTTQTLALTNGTVQTVTMTGNCTFTMPTNVAGKSFILICTQDATGSRTATFTSVKWPGGTAPTLTTTASTGRDILTFVADGTNWYGTYAQAFA